jgi:hypothetical protein
MPGPHFSTDQKLQWRTERVSFFSFHGVVCFATTTSCCCAEKYGRVVADSDSRAGRRHAAAITNSNASKAAKMTDLKRNHLFLFLFIIPSHTKFGATREILHGRRHTRKSTQ